MHGELYLLLQIHARERERAKERKKDNFVLYIYILLYYILLMKKTTSKTVFYTEGLFLSYNYINFYEKL